MIFFLKKIYYSIFKKNYNFTKTLINQYYTGKKKTVLSFSSIGGGTRFVQDEEFFNLTKKYNVFKFEKENIDFSIFFLNDKKS